MVRMQPQACRQLFGVGEIPLERLRKTTARNRHHALIALFIYWLAPQMAAASGNAIWISASVFLMTGILVALRSFADLKH